MEQKQNLKSPDNLYSFLILFFNKKIVNFKTQKVGENMLYGVVVSWHNHNY